MRERRKEEGNIWKTSNQEKGEKKSGFGYVWMLGSHEDINK